MWWVTKYGRPVALLLIFVGLALHLTRTVPPFENSDEAEHFIYAHTIAEQGILPQIPTRDALNNAASPLERWNLHAHHPPLYYLLTAGLISGFDRGDLPDLLRTNDLIFTGGITAGNPNKWLHPPTTTTGGTLTALTVARWANIALGLVTLALIYRAGWFISGRRAVGLVALLLTIALPTFIVVHSSVSNDPVVILLFSAGVLWSARAVSHRRPTWRDDLLIGAILSGAALAKLTGAALWGVVILALILAVINKTRSQRRALQTLITAAGVFIVTAGWWYVRNLQLYGDPLALDATAAIWGRAADTDATSILAEVERVARSFWLMIGYRHQPIFAPDWFYTLTIVLVSGAVIGWLWRRQPRDISRGSTLILLAALLGVVTLVIIGTVSVDISYGRLLLPAIVPLAFLSGAGLLRLPLRIGWLMSGGLLAVTIGVLVGVIPAHYPRLQAMPSPPPEAIGLGWQVDDLALVAVSGLPDTISPADDVTFDVYLSGNHPRNPALSATLIDSITRAPLGQVITYAGMSPVDTLAVDQIYQTTVRVPVELSETILSPRAVWLQLRWFDVEAGDWLPLSNSDGVVENVALWHDPRYSPPQVTHSTAVQFGDTLTLRGYDLPETAQRAGDTVTLGLLWAMHTTTSDDYALTVQLFDESGAFVAQADGEISGLPSTLWRANLTAPATITLTLPVDLPPAAYTIRLGWYNRADLTRLPVSGGDQQDNLYILPDVITVTP